VDCGAPSKLPQVVSQALGCRPVSSSDELSPKLNMLLRVFLPRPCRSAPHYWARVTARRQLQKLPGMRRAPSMRTRVL